MDNLTHSLVGLTAAKAGLEKLSPGATALCLLAASAPDVDIVTLIFRGRWSFLEHHRGITHSIVGTLALVVLLPLVFYLIDRLIAQLEKRKPRVKLKGLLLVSLAVTATHPFLDWTNNYGVRLLLPWNARWFYGDFLFVIDPFFWMVLGGASFLLTSKSKKQLIAWLVVALIPTYLVLVRSAGETPSSNNIPLRLFWITGLVVLVILCRTKIGREGSARVAIVALVTVAIYSCALAAIHVVALRRATVQAGNIANSHTERLLRVAAMPTVANPTAWLCVLETDRATYRFNLSVPGNLPDAPQVVRFEKPVAPAADVVARAAEDDRAQVFLGFARFPVVRVIGDDCLTQTLVQFADLRYTEPGKGRGTFSLDVPVECPVVEAR
ncbi:MAG TPA: metal-dependent hydrolase [Pyrinomonadaceae bacterium]|nr:metal-dependent hydrolase [Pyrinomonadaceae bacterium]